MIRTMICTTIALVHIALPEPAFASNPKVLTEPLKKINLYEVAHYWGRIEPLNLAHLYSPIQGIVKEIHVKPGQSVKKGDLVAVVQSSEIGLQMRPTPIRSPISGRLFGTHVSIQSLVKKDAHLFTVFDPLNFKVTLQVTPEDSKHLAPGQTLPLSMDGVNLESVVRSISPEIDLTTGTISVEVTFTHPNSEKVALRPGQIAQAEFQFNHHEGFLLSKNNVKKRINQHFVQIVDQDHKVSEMIVEIGLRRGDQMEVLNKDLKEGDQLIIKASSEHLFTGQEVELSAPGPAGT